MASASEIGAGCTIGDKLLGLIADSRCPGSTVCRPETTGLLLTPVLVTSAEMIASHMNEAVASADPVSTREAWIM